MKVKNLVVLIIIVLISTTTQAFGEKEKSRVNYKDEAIEVEIYQVEAGKILYPIREIADFLEIKVGWNNELKTVELSKDGEKISIKSNEKIYIKNNFKKQSKNKFLLKNGKIYGDIEIFSEGFNYKISGQEKDLKIEDKIEDRLDKYFLALEEVDGFRGNVLIAKNNEILIKKGYGYKNIEEKIGFNPEDKMSIGSITKQFTALGIMKLEEGGYLSLDDTIDKYIKDFKNGDKITIHNLLTHSSGIEDFTQKKSTFRLLGKIGKKPNHTDIINLVKNSDLKFNPNEKYQYSNSNYVILSYIIEQVTQLPYDRYLGEVILSPLGMKNTGFHKGEAKKTNVLAYLGKEEPEEIKEEKILAWSFGAGSMYSTLDDLYKWDRGVKEGKLLKEESMKKIFRGYNQISKDIKSGYGWEIIGNNMENRIRHGGNTIGMTALIERNIGEDITIIILTNIGQYELKTRSENIQNMILKKPYKTPKKSKEVKNKGIRQLEKYVGSYDIGKNLSLKINLTNRGMQLKVPMLGNIDLYPISNNRFKSPDIQVEVEFQYRSGNIESILVKPFGVKGVKK